MSHVSQSLGRAVRSRRAARGLSASELARTAGVSRATLVEIEAGRANPTIETVRALASRLGVPLVELLADADGTDFDVVRSTSGQRTEFPMIKSRLVHRLQLDRALIEVWDMTLMPGRVDARGHAHGVSEHLYVREGRLRVGTEDHETELGPEDFVSFRADRSHFYEAVGEPVRLITYVTYPSASASGYALSDQLPTVDLPSGAAGPAGQTRQTVQNT